MPRIAFETLRVQGFPLVNFFLGFFISKFLFVIFCDCIYQHDSDVVDYYQSLEKVIAFGQ